MSATQDPGSPPLVECDVFAFLEELTSSCTSNMAFLAASLRKPRLVPVGGELIGEEALAKVELEGGFADDALDAVPETFFAALAGVLEGAFAKYEVMERAA